MRRRLGRRYLDVLASIYIYNEHRGYTAIDRVLSAVRARAPDDLVLIAAIERHRADERKHYVMFRRWFERRGVMPLALDRTFGHIDRFVEIMFRTSISRMDIQAIIADDALFARLCRVISLTERRGYRQLDALLSNRTVRADRVLTRIFEVIKRDEPTHWAPYEQWLQTCIQPRSNWWGRAVDSFVHAELLLVKLPILFLNPFVSRRVDWLDGDRAANGAEAQQLSASAS